MAGTGGDGIDRKEAGTKPAAEEARLSARLSDLNKRLSHVRKEREFEKDQAGGEEQTVQARASAMAVGLRLSSELVAGVLVGALIGWGIDHFFSSSPWGLIIFVLLGFTAGVMNVMRTAGLMAKQSERLKTPKPD